MRRDDISVRPVTEDEIPDWIRALNTGFLREPSVPVTEVEHRKPMLTRSRTVGAFDGARCVATFRSFAQELTAVGGALVGANAISNVTVTATHRRRGLLSRMMATDLAAARDRGDVLATLIAAEYPIYGRYGFGPATTATQWSVDVPRAGLDPRWAGPDDGARIDLVDAEDVRKHGPDLYERFRRAQPGAVDRDDRWWQTTTGALRVVGPDPWTEPFHALYRSPSGEVEGLLTFKPDDVWGDAKQPLDTASVRGLIALTPAAERALWLFLASIDWITTIRTGYRAPDDLLPHLLPDPRAARITTQADWLWIRVLDVVRAMEARTYAGSGSLVIEVSAPDGLSGGRFQLDASPDGATCAPSTRSADLVVGSGELAELWLGDASAVRLAALGRVEEERAGAAAVADALLRTSRRPWCPDMF
ncbi:GNAT family N-acetyltransferase [Streptomyces sp. NPDC091292]|uniref:GNAT family N-acetyltransferase n=1 Tax=Streptomyces sp. NPDC091292 TaxID=3365991 RepID=UPI003807045F